MLLDLEAVWCHWCHVMDATTYQDPAAVALLKSKYIVVKVDQDSRPDLASRYEDYGWPATIVFDRDGREIVKRQGYIAPREMVSMLRAIVADPAPGPSVVAEQPIEFAASPVLPAEMREQLAANYRLRYDSKNGSWGFQQKFLDWDGVEYAMLLAHQGDAAAEKMALQTLTAQLNLIDPVWGGVYQYSTDGDWKHPHFEKIMQFQAENLRIYAMAWQQWRKPEYLQAALAIRSFLRTFLTSPDGAFYTSQNADLIDGQHSCGVFQIERYGAAASGCAARGPARLRARERMGDYSARRVVSGYGRRHLHGRRGARRALGDRTSLARWRRIPARRAGLRRPLSRRHACHDPRLLEPLRRHPRPRWFDRARHSLEFIASNFRNTASAGYVTARAATDAAYRPHPERDENVALARAANAAWRASGDSKFRKIAEEAMRYVVTPQVARAYTAAPTLLADAELTAAPELLE